MSGYGDTRAFARKVWGVPSTWDMHVMMIGSDTIYHEVQDHGKPVHHHAYTPPSGDVARAVEIACAQILAMGYQETRAVGFREVGR